MKKGIYKKDYIRNSKEANVVIHELSDYPDKSNSNLILVIYSTNETKTLERLNNDSLIEFYYQRTKYIYKITNHYAIDKSNYDLNNRNINKNKKTITLITYNKKDKIIESIYIGNLIDEINY